MQGYQCKCGAHRGSTSMGIAPCGWCSKCGTTYAYGPSSHSTERRPHEMLRDVAETDGGQVPGVTRCVHCKRTKAQLEAESAPMVDYKQGS